MSTSGMLEAPSSQSDSARDPYRGVVIVLLALALLGTVGALAGGLALGNPVLLDAAVTLGLSAGILIGVALVQTARARPHSRDHEASSPLPAEEVHQEDSDRHEHGTPMPTDVSPVAVDATAMRARAAVIARAAAAARAAAVAAVPVRIGHWFRNFHEMGTVRVRTAVAGALAIALLLLNDFFAIALDPLAAGIAAAMCLTAAGLAATAVRYLAEIEPARLPEGPGLLRGARIVAWILVLAAASIGLEWAGQETALRILHTAVLAVNVALCYGLFTVQQAEHEALETFPLDLGVLWLLGNRTNVLASVLDSGERQLGIDLRSTWALTVVRRSLEPLVIGLCFVGWLSTSLTVVGVEEQGLVERLGVPVGGQPLLPGIHMHWPWPVDRVFRIPVLRVQMLTVGHEGEEGGGPEDVLWARQHAANEYTLLLGDGRDLITVDAAVQFRITDARAWRYHSQNPGDALRAIAYRAVMRTTVNRTLAEALSENVVTTTARMRAMVQQDADALDLGVEVLGFTVGGMHPPVPVASAYQAVVSAALGKVTATVNAQAVRNRTVPLAESSVLVNENNARAEGVEALARAVGEAWSFLTLQSQYSVAPGEYFFRRRLETLEKGLAGRRFTVVDTRFQRDGGELWVNP
jgi:regulator of protease activity HflC (stomatin/prohibitin superfamily)